MIRLIAFALLFAATAAHADATLFILYGTKGRTIVGRESLVVTSGADGTIDLYDTTEAPPAGTIDSIRSRFRLPGPAAGQWTWRFHSKAGVESGGDLCTGHTEQRTGSGGGGVFVFLDCKPRAAKRP